MTAQTDNARAGVIGSSQFGIFGAAHRNDLFDCTQRLHIVHDRRTHVEAEHGREIRRLNPGVRSLAFERFDQSRFLAANVSSGAPVDPDIEVIVCAENSFPEKIFGASLLQCTLENPGAFNKLAPDVDVSQMHVIGVAGDDHAFEHLMRVFVDDLFVFERARLGFIGIADEINRLSALAIDEGPLQSAGKTGPSTTTQAGYPDFFAQLFRAAETFAIRQSLWRQRQCLS